MFGVLGWGVVVVRVALCSWLGWCQVGVRVSLELWVGVPLDGVLWFFWPLGVSRGNFFWCVCAGQGVFLVGGGKKSGVFWCLGGGDVVHLKASLSSLSGPLVRVSHIGTGLGGSVRIIA